MATPTELERSIQIYNDINSNKELVAASLIKNLYTGKIGNKYTLFQAFEYHNKQLKVQIGEILT